MYLLMYCNVTCFIKAFILHYVIINSKATVHFIKIKKALRLPLKTVTKVKNLETKKF